VAIKLHGQSAVGMFAQGPAEPAATELDAGEAAWLRQRGWRIFDVHMDSFVLKDSDEFTPTLVFLVGFCEFLDGITDGDDALLTGIAFPRPIELPLPEPELADAEGALIRREAGNGLSIWLPKKTIVRFEFAGTAAAAAKAGSAAVLAVSIDMHTAKAWTLAERLPSPVAALRVEQKGADGTAWRQQSGTQRIFLGGRFDATHPFTLELELAPGSYSIHGPARLGVAPR